MKTFPEIFLAFVLFSGVAQAQNSLQVSKSPGETITFQWSFTAASEVDIDSFVLQSAAAIQGPYADVKTILKTDRQTTHPAGSSPVFYQLLSVKAASRSTPSNPVAISVKLPAPVGLGGR